MCWEPGTKSKIPLDIDLFSDQPGISRLIQHLPMFHVRHFDSLCESTYKKHNMVFDANTRLRGGCL